MPAFNPFIKLFIGLGLFLSVSSSSAQIELMDSVTLAHQKTYTDLQMALNAKDSVVRLVLRKQKLKAFPSEIYQFRNLQYLDISKNRIKALPDSIYLLQNLQYFICSKTGLESIPDTISALKNLKHVDFSQNELTAIPVGFCQLSELIYADFWDNNLDTFPSELYLLKNLKRMDFRNILISRTKQDAIQKQLPQTKIYFSAPCNCGQ